MGLFDSVRFECPECGERMSVQSKAGDCILKDYDSEAVPLNIAGDILGEVHCCQHCWSMFEVEMVPRVETVSLTLKAT